MKHNLDCDAMCEATTHFGFNFLKINVLDLNKRNGICIKVSVRRAGQPADRWAAGSASTMKGS